MRIQKIHCFQLAIPLRITFGQANQSTQHSDSIVLRLETENGSVGYGECAPRTYVSGEDINQVRTSIQRYASTVYGTDFTEITDLECLTLSLLVAGYGPAAVCALELALLDAWSKEYQQDLRQVLGAEGRNTLAYSGIVPYGPWEVLVPVLASFRFPRWKFKATGSWQENAARIRTIRKLPGMTAMAGTSSYHTAVRLDANGGWSKEEALQHIEAALAEGVYSFEQPVAVGDDDVARELTSRYGAMARIMADEALVTYADAERHITHSNYNHFNLKLSKNGGIFSSLRIYRLARQHGIPCQLGAQYGETSILSAAGALFADLAPHLTDREGALGTWLLQEDLTDHLWMVDRSGKLPTRPAAPGFGLDIDELRLNRYSLRTDYWKKPN